MCIHVCWNVRIAIVNNVFVYWAWFENSISGRISIHGCSHPQHCTWLAWTPVRRVLLSECDTNRNNAIQKSPSHVCAISVTMQILHCWQNIKFSTPFFFAFFIRLWKETILPRSTVCGLTSFATWNSGKWLKFSASQKPCLFPRQKPHTKRKWVDSSFPNTVADFTLPP